MGHSSFVISYDNGINIVTDYGKENAWVEWGWDSPIKSIGSLVPDVMTFSHQHDDHYDPNRIPEEVSHVLFQNDSLTIKGIEIHSVQTCESDLNEYSNSSFIFEYRGIKICHLGDAQIQIMNINDPDIRSDIESIFPKDLDLLFMTIEGTQKFIPQAEKFIQLLNPKRVIPMHYWSNEYLSEFIEYLNDKEEYKITQLNDSKFDLHKGSENQNIEIIVLEIAPFN